MPKEFTLQRQYNLNSVIIKENIISCVFEKNKWNLSDVQETENGYIIKVVVPKSFYSNKGEDVSIDIYKMGDNESLVTVKSSLKSKSQIYDWGKNQKNVELIHSFASQKCTQQELNIPQEHISITNKNKTKKTNDMVVNKFLEKPLESVSCKYCGGHPYLNKESTGTLYVYQDRIEYHIFKKQFEIILQDIMNVDLVTQEHLLQRFTATRLATFGFLGMAIPKKSMHTTSYIIIEYTIKGISNTLFLSADNSFSFSSQKNLSIKLHSAIMRAKIEASDIK